MGCDNDDEGQVIIVNTISELIVSDPNFSILAAALDKADLIDSLDGEEINTLLAPSDRAFIEAGITDLDRFTDEEIRSIIEYHLFDGAVFFSEFDLGPNESKNGTLYISLAGNNLAINGETFFLTINIDAGNGLIHTIDQVLLPPERTITEVIVNDAEYSILEEAVEKAGLTGFFNQTGPYTLFAPSNDAFEDYFDLPGITGLNDLTAEQLNDILQYHVVEGQLFTPDLQAGAQTTLGSESFDIRFENDIILEDNNDASEDAVIIRTNDNKLATNGVIHRISRLLIPNN